MKEFRPGRRVPALAAWTWGAACLAVFLTPQSHPEAFLAALSIGPVALLAHLARRALVQVKIDPLLGVILQDRRTIPWHEITAIRRRRGWVGSIRLARMPWRHLTRILEGWLPHPGACHVSLSMPLFMAAGIIGVSLWATTYLLLPLLAMIPAAADRIILRREGGGEIVLPDLDRPNEFLREAVHWRVWGHALRGWTGARDRAVIIGGRP